MELLRKNLKALGKQLNLLGMNRNLSGLCLKNRTLDSYNISNIKFLKIFIVVFSNIVPCNVGL